MKPKPMTLEYVRVFHGLLRQFALSLQNSGDPNYGDMIKDCYKVIRQLDKIIKVNKP